MREEPWESRRQWGQATMQGLGKAAAVCRVFQMGCSIGTEVLQEAGHSSGDTVRPGPGRVKGLESHPIPFGAEGDGPSRPGWLGKGELCPLRRQGPTRRRGSPFPGFLSSLSGSLRTGQLAIHLVAGPSCKGTEPWLF